MRAQALLVGLGNPGPQYAGTRHNIGFMALDLTVGRHAFSAWKPKYDGLVAEGRIGDCRVFALKPLTFMNRSGISVAQMARFHKIPPEDILVFHDELDLPLGKVRAKQGGGSGGHNGLKSLDAHVGNATWRVRLGIGHPGHKDLVTGYVLGTFRPEERAGVDDMLARVDGALELLLAGDAGGFMNRASPPPPPKATP